ncbi:MAG: beta-galactosidase [Rikenellaceae bacterium]
MKKILLSLALFASVASASAASLESTAKTKIGELNALVEQAKKRKIDTRREDCALWMANEFLMYAAWDEQNIDQNEYQYTTWKPYKAEARRLAEELPSFEREEVIKMLDTAIDELTGVISGKYTRRPTVQIDWSSIKPEGNQFYSNSHPTYFNSYFTIPDHQCNEYVGIPRSSGLNINMIRNFDGGISPNGEKQLGKISDKYSGYVLLWHGGAPKWIRDIDPDCAIGKRLFTHYDIDNPTIRKAWEATFKEFVPKIAQTKAADMGYVLANEPHWMSIEKRWATGEVSDHTKAKFRTWLEAKHKDIARLNKLWGSSFSSFDEVDITVPISKTILLKAQGYDWMRFNMDRVTEWFTFLNDGVKEYDPKAKTHIKIIPHMLSNDYLDHGLDMEQLYTLTDIVGNDAKIVKRSPFKKDPEQWEARYAFNWEEVALSYDFFHSVNPKGANINSESHFLSASQFRDIYMTN